MRILYIADSYRPSRSACANRTVVLADALRTAGHDVCVLASSDSLIAGTDSHDQPGHVTFFDTFPLKEKTLVNRLKNNFGGRREAMRAADRMGDFDVVVCTTPPLLLTTAAMKIAKRKAAKLVLDIRDIWPDVAYEMGAFTPNSLYGPFFDRIAKKGLRQSDLVVSVSPGKVEKLRGRMPQGCADRVVLVPNGIDEEFLLLESDADFVERYGLDGERKTCVYAGNVGLAQGLGTILDIAAVRRDVRFLIFGEGADKSHLEQRAASEGLANVEFHGTVGQSAIKAVLENADMSFIPLISSKLSDSIPTKLYEALACGCPVLLAAAGDAVTILNESGLGRAALPEDRGGLMAAFDFVIDSEWTSEQRERAKSYILESHSRQKFAEGFVESVEMLDEGLSVVR